MWFYSQSTGQLKQDDKLIATGYSGTQLGRNNPQAETLQGVGPIPQGIYTIGSSYYDSKLGPYVMHLDPQSSTNTFGRTLFRIHGNNTQNDASHGCIILGFPVRVEIAQSGDKNLTVTE